MKKFPLLFVFVICCTQIFAQLPYSKVLNYTENDFKENNFKYDKNKNQYILNKSNSLNNVSNIVSAINGHDADMRPHEEDYRVIVQNGEDGISSVAVIFYKDDKFHDLQNWLIDNNINYSETTSGKKSIQKFAYNDIYVDIIIESVSVTTTSANTRAAAKSFDDSYNVYTYMLSTGIEPSSKWHTKQAKKKKKQEEKGAKQSIDDLF